MQNIVGFQLHIVNTSCPNVYDRLTLDLLAVNCGLSRFLKQR